MELFPTEAVVLVFIKVFSDISSISPELLNASFLLVSLQSITVTTLFSEEFPELFPCKTAIVISVVLVIKLATLTVVSFSFLVFFFFASDEGQELIIIKRVVATTSLLALLLDLVHGYLLKNVAVGSEHILTFIYTQLVIFVRVELVEDVLCVSCVNVKTVAGVFAASWVNW